jgi:serine/threonine protein kinase
MTTIEIAPGGVFGDDRYRLRRLLGTGGMASVWLAHDSRLDREVAVKVLSDVLALDPGFVARFEREARLAGGLRHPHLVDIFDFSAHGTRPYLVMEYLGGGTLAERLRAGLGPEWDPVVLARELLDALAHVHAAGIVHRDIKPANVLIGADGRARLTDFGIAQFPESTRLTSTGLIVGTEAYLAPEVRRGGVADARSDLFACGVLLRECLGPTPPPRLRRLVALLTYDEPAHRPASAREALALLDEEDAAEPDRTQAFPAPTAAFAAARPAPTAQLPPTVKAAARPASGHRRLGALAAVVAVTVAAIAVTLGLASGRGTERGPLVVPPADTSLTRLLDTLDASIDRAQSRR